MYNVICGIISTLDHQNTGVDIAFSVLSCLIQEIRCKIHITVTMESKMVAISAVKNCCQNYDFDTIPAQNILIPILKQYQGKNLKHQESNEIIYDSPDRNKGLYKKGQQRIEIYATFQLFLLSIY